MNLTDNALDSLYATLQDRKKADPGSSYVAGLHAKGLDAILKKIGEESAEVLLAAKGGDKPALVHELADLWFHSLVLMSAKDIAPAEVLTELSRRKGRSGLEEKASRTK
ncbi:MAG: phosphoribosyl-ATP diphosphatase [Pseudomonadota bacterium]